ncbi:MAG: DUF2889 domain-containing protein [Rhodospirillaceae bacterium]
MPLPEPAERDPVQTRTIEVSSFRRRDGMWDVEGRLVDVAADSIPDYAGGTIQAGTPIHDMRIRLTLNGEVDIVSVAVSMDAHPYPVCPGIVPAFQALTGVRIGRGWNRRVREMFGGVNGCVHLVDLLGPVGTIGFKTVKREAGQDSRPPAEKPDDKPYQVNSCHVLASDGELVRRRWPELYTGAS